MYCCGSSLKFLSEDVQMTIPLTNLLAISHGMVKTAVGTVLNQPFHWINPDMDYEWFTKVYDDARGTIQHGVRLDCDEYTAGPGDTFSVLTSVFLLQAPNKEWWLWKIDVHCQLIETTYYKHGIKCPKYVKGIKPFTSFQNIAGEFVKYTCDMDWSI